MLCFYLLYCYVNPRAPHSFPTRRSSDLRRPEHRQGEEEERHEGGRVVEAGVLPDRGEDTDGDPDDDRQQGGQQDQPQRSEEHTSELQSRGHLVCRLLLEKKKQYNTEYEE